MIAISLAPNFETKDALLALKQLFLPWRWRKGTANQRLVAKLQAILGRKEIYTVNSARWGLYLLLQNLRLEKDTEVLLQAFTCVSVPGPVLWNNLKPVYVDILERELTMDPLDLERKITAKSRVIIVQHTFGIPARMDEIMTIAKKHNLIVIEDCAHTLGGKHRDKLLGTIGDASIFSFGRDKAISSVFGGAIMVNNQKVFTSIKSAVAELPLSKNGWVLQQLMHPILFELIIKPLYFTAQIGKIKLVFAQKVGLLSKAIASHEKSGGKPAFECAKLSNALAELACFQLSRLEAFNARRREIVEIYNKELHQSGFDGQSLLRYPIFVDEPRKLLLAARKEKILLGDWYEVIAPKDTDLKAVQYVAGSCPVAESVAKREINLPTYYTLKNSDLKKIVEFTLRTVPKVNGYFRDSP
ncbi:MAG: DegT/DnrJ/EryC1/StrS family aminotransferase [bacterium]|nr:DegT/DnrJ/EryC1/StrS family aminotransferase [bacterium]